MNEKKEVISIHTMKRDLISIGCEKEAKLLTAYHHKFAFTKRQRSKSVKAIIKMLSGWNYTKTSQILKNSAMFNWGRTPEGAIHWEAIVIKLRERGL